MARLLAIDYGSKRVGLAVSDTLQIVASGLATVHSKDVIVYLENYFKQEAVETIIVGEPKTLANLKSDSARFIDPFVVHLQRKFPDKKIVRYDERFTSAIAHQTLLLGGAKKKDRQNKATVDLISAIIILQDYMASTQPR